MASRTRSIRSDAGHQLHLEVRRRSLATASAHSRLTDRIVSSGGEAAGSSRGGARRQPSCLPPTFVQAFRSPPGGSMTLQRLVIGVWIAAILAGSPDPCAAARADKARTVSLSRRIAVRRRFAVPIGPCSSSTSFPKATAAPCAFRTQAGLELEWWANAHLKHLGGLGWRRSGQALARPARLRPSDRHRPWDRPPPPVSASKGAARANRPASLQPVQRQSHTGRGHPCRRRLVKMHESASRRGTRAIDPGRPTLTEDIDRRAPCQSPA